MIEMKCPNCGAPLQLHDSAVGNARACPKCKATFWVGKPPPDKANVPGTANGKSASEEA